MVECQNWTRADYIQRQKISALTVKQNLALSAGKRLAKNHPSPGRFDPEAVLVCDNVGREN
jgi:hypothetical protein